MVSVRFKAEDGRSLLRDGDQLRLPFPEELDAPWGGQSPRVLTRVGLGVIFNPRGEKSTSAKKDPFQLDLFARRGAHNRSRPLVERAPSAFTLVPLPWEVHDGS